MTETTPPAPGADIGFDFNRPTIIALLYLASFLTGITGLVGLILAYVWKSEPGDEWARSHYSFHIRSFWYGLIGALICTILMLVLIGFIGFVALSVWLVVRTVLALLKAQRKEAIANPETLLW